jgi:rare lipoprotein A
MSDLAMNPSKVLSSNLHLGVLALTAGLFSAQGCALTSGSPPSPADQSVETIGPRQPISPQAKVGETPATAVKPAAKPKPVNIGKASWYGPGFGGKKTASGETFDDDKLTAAHKTLPLGSAAKVTNLSNGKSVKVEINDRGPYAGNRIIDLSRAAAHAIGMIDDGVVDVRIDPLTNEGVGSGVD